MQKPVAETDLRSAVTASRLAVQSAPSLVLLEGNEAASLERYRWNLTRSESCGNGPANCSVIGWFLGLNGSTLKHDTLDVLDCVSVAVARVKVYQSLSSGEERRALPHLFC